MTNSDTIASLNENVYRTPPALRGQHVLPRALHAVGLIVLAVRSRKLRQNVEATEPDQVKSGVSSAHERTFPRLHYGVVWAWGRAWCCTNSSRCWSVSLHAQHNTFQHRRNAQPKYLAVRILPPDIAKLCVVRSIFHRQMYTNRALQTLTKQADKQTNDW